MNILIINIDSKLPNLALKKIEIYHKNQGDNIEYDSNLFVNWADKIYVSCIFTKNKHKCLNYKHYGAEIGGTGYDVLAKLPQEIESIKPRINIGFTSRGCIRKCEFCFVPKKEGALKIEGDLYDVWDGKAKEVILMDNNILGLPDHFKLVCEQAQKENVRLDFNQGLDIRLVTDEIAQILSKTKQKDVRFALDYPQLIPIFDKKLSILRKYMPTKHFFVYVLVGFNTTWDEDMERLLFLKENKCRPYLMRHENTSKEDKYIRLANWVNTMNTFYSYTFDEFLKHFKKISSKKQYYENLAKHNQEEKLF